jgi:hypothetical protein
MEKSGALSATIGSGEQPGLAPRRQATQRSFGRVVGEADPAVIEEASKRGSATSVLAGSARFVARRSGGALLFVARSWRVSNENKPVVCRINVLWTIFLQELVRHVLKDLDVLSVALHDTRTIDDIGFFKGQT